MNFLGRVIPGGLCQLRSGWDAVDESGITDQWRSGSKRANVEAVLTEQLRGDMDWWRRMLSAHPPETIQYGP